ncbi:MAG: SDR family NAD(P)-dependent oxidoreductase [Tannerellaceae bacterium]|jgi:short-subunit dehydrogenase|nr:SDR family NAD(P)-dependent oxidoreductase [Tannerellaceae bacterium]
MSDSLLRHKTIWIIGANSDIAKALMLYITTENCTLKLFSRDMISLQNFIEKNNIKAECIYFDITDRSQTECLLQSFNTPDGIIITAGYLPCQNCMGDIAEINKTVASNYLGILVFLEKIKEKLKNDRCRFLCIVSSVGGDRGKSSNSIYASSKSGLTCYLEGLEQELTPFGITVMIIKPIWIKTKMTGKDNKIQKSFISQTPEQVAHKIYTAIINNRKGVRYTSLWAFCISIIIRLIPGVIYRHLDI